MIRSLQILLVAAVVAVGYHIFRTQRHEPATAATLGKDLVLGPAGIAEIRLGMTVAEANATGNIRYQPVWPTSGSRDCAELETEGAVIAFSRTHGLAAIVAPDGVRTAEGIGMGATLAQLRAVYPKLHPVNEGTPEKPSVFPGNYAAPVPGNAAASYRFLFDVKGLRFISLVLNDQGSECAAGA